MRFSWDDSKNQKNKLKHGLGFEEAIGIFNGSEKIEFDSEHSTPGEDRFRAYGWLPKHQGVVVVFVELVDDDLRIISAYGV